ncbi:MAG: hypothetical protein N3A53_08325, partial [Verrucomicrobiae bacterium]|nr:hypothetical protein [Verrucomicrobiae bacterium]
MSNISIGIRKTVIAGLVALFAVAQADATLLVWYKFNEGSGTTTANSGAAGAAGNLTFFGSTAFSASGFSPDPSGYSMNNSPGSTMGGTGGGAWTAGSLDALDNLTAMTVTGWYRSDGSFAGLARLVNRADNTIGAGMWAIYTDGTSGRLQANIGGATTVNTSGNYWQANKWIFFAVTYQGGGSPSVNFFIGDETPPVTALTSSTSGTLPANLGDGSNVLVVG